MESEDHVVDRSDKQRNTEDADVQLVLESNHELAGAECHQEPESVRSVRIAENLKKKNQISNETILQRIGEMSQKNN